MDRLGSRAWAGVTQQAAASPARSHRNSGYPKRASGQVFEFLNYHLSPVLEGDFGVVINVKVHAYGFDSVGRNAGCEDLFGDNGCVCSGAEPPHGSEGHGPRLPTERMRERSGRE